MWHIKKDGCSITEEIVYFMKNSKQSWSILVNRYYNNKLILH